MVLLETFLWTIVISKQFQLRPTPSAIQDFLLIFHKPFYTAETAYSSLSRGEHIASFFNPALARFLFLGRIYPENPISTHVWCDVLP